MNYLIYGNDQGLIDEALSKLQKKHNDSDIEKIDATKITISSILENANTPSLFYANKVLLYSNVNFFNSKVLTDSDFNALLTYLANPASFTTLVFIVEEEKLDARKKTTKQYQKYFKQINCNHLEERNIAKVIDDKLKQLPYELTIDQTHYLYDSIRNDYTKLNNVFSILSLQTQPLTMDEFLAIIPRRVEDNVFELMNSLLKNNSSHTFLMLNDFKQNNLEPIQLIGLLASQIRVLFQVNHLYQRGFSENEIVSELGIHPYRVKQALKNRHNLSRIKALRSLATLAEFDQQIKTSKIDKWLAIELFCLEFNK